MLLYVRPARIRFFVDVYKVRPVGTRASCIQGYKRRDTTTTGSFFSTGPIATPRTFHRANYNTLIERLDSVGDC
jgi:hypothetical protein